MPSKHLLSPLDHSLYILNACEQFCMMMIKRESSNVQSEWRSQCRPYYTAATTAWVGNQSCCIRLVQILFEPAETIRCYQWHTIITSKSVFRSASGIRTWPNTIHPVHNTAGRNSTDISTKFPSLCCWHWAVHGSQAKQCGIITPSHQ